MGNTSLAGARLAALSRQARQMAEELARRTEHVDLSTDAEFQRGVRRGDDLPGSVGRKGLPFSAQAKWKCFSTTSGRFADSLC